jgi:hypothetical protein
VTYRDDAKALMAHDAPKSRTVIIPIRYYKQHDIHNYETKRHYIMHKQTNLHECQV